jgi:hypothetical protein
MISARTLRPDEAHPAGFATGYEAMPIDRDWTWVAESGGKIVGILLAGSCHGLIYLMRVCTVQGCSPMVIRALLEKMRSDCAERGCKGYFFHADPTMPMDRKILRACRKYGGVQLRTPQVISVGSLSRRTPCHPS